MKVSGGWIATLVFVALLFGGLLEKEWIGPSRKHLDAAFNARWGIVEAAPNCRQYLDKAIELADSASRGQWTNVSIGDRIAVAKVYVQIAEVCTKF